MATRIRCDLKWVLLPLVMLICLVTAVAAQAQAYDIQVKADPPRVPYGADARVNIRVTVYDDQGSLAEDGTRVAFYTTLGTIPALAYTRRGQVTVLLENTAGPGLAVVTVTVGASSQSVNVDFLGAGVTVAPAPKRPSYRLHARRIYYSVDLRVFDLRDQAEFTTPGFTVSADSLQFDIRRGLLLAQYNVTLTAGQTVLKGEKLRLEMGAQRGWLVATDPEIRYYLLRLPQLSSQESETPIDADNFRPLETQPTRTWILCREAIVFPGEQIQFRHPEFYLNNFDHRLFTLPYHVLDLRSSSAGTFFNSQISVTSDAGLNVDFPIYYAADANHIGSLHLRNVTKGSSFYKGVSGLQLSLEEEYLVGDRGDGGLYLDDLTRPTRSATWEHVQNFGPTRVDLRTSYDRYSEETPYTTRVGLGITRSFGSTSMFLNTNWNKTEGDQDGVSELSAYLPPLRLGKSHFSMNFNPYLGFSRTITAAIEEQPESRTQNFYQGMRVGLEFPVVHLLGGTISTNLSNDTVHDGDDNAYTNYFDANLRFSRALTKSFTTSLSYGYNVSTSTSDLSGDYAPSQRVSLDLSGSKPNVWSLFTYSTYNIDSSTLYSSANLKYFLPWNRTRTGSPRWYFQYSGSLSTTQDTTTSDHLFSVGRDIGAYSLVLHYSPTGNTAVTGIGSGTGKHWSLEVMRQGW